MGFAQPFVQLLRMVLRLSTMDLSTARHSLSRITRRIFHALGSAARHQRVTPCRNRSNARIESNRGYLWILSVVRVPSERHLCLYHIDSLHEYANGNNRTATIILLLHRAEQDPSVLLEHRTRRVSALDLSRAGVCLVTVLYSLSNAFTTDLAEIIRLIVLKFPFVVVVRRFEHDRIALRLVIIKKQGN